MANLAPMTEHSYPHNYSGDLTKVTVVAPVLFTHTDHIRETYPVGTYEVPTEVANHFFFKYHTTEPGVSAPVPGTTDYVDKLRTEATVMQQRTVELAMRQAAERNAAHAAMKVSVEAELRKEVEANMRLEMAASMRAEIEAQVRAEMMPKGKAAADTSADDKGSDTSGDNSDGDTSDNTTKGGKKSSK